MACSVPVLSMTHTHSSLRILIVTHPPRYHHVCTVGNLPHKHESRLPGITGPNPENSHARVSHQPDAPHLPLFADTEDTCLHHNEDVVLCHVTRSLFFLHD